MSRKNRKMKGKAPNVEVVGTPYEPRHINELLNEAPEEFTDADWRAALRMRIRLERIGEE